MLKTKKRKSHKWQNRRGATTVELAAVLPVFLLLVLGCMEFSRISLMRSLGSNACYEAARASMVTGATEEQAEAIVDSVLGRLAIDGAETTVRFVDRNGVETDFDGSQRITVAVSIPYGENNPILPANFGNITFDSQITLWTSRN
jgi:Flp pilus assembly protein TadG